MSRHRHVRNMALDDYEDDDYYSEEEEEYEEEAEEEPTKQVAYVAYTAPSKGVNSQPVQKQATASVSLLAIRNVMNVVGSSFSSERVKGALLKYDGNEERAVNYLLDGGGAEMNEPMEEGTESNDAAVVDDEDAVMEEPHAAPQVQIPVSLSSLGGRVIPSLSNLVGNSAGGKPAGGSLLSSLSQKPASLLTSVGQKPTVPTLSGLSLSSGLGKPSLASLSSGGLKPSTTPPSLANLSSMGGLAKPSLSSLTAGGKSKPLLTTSLRGSKPSGSGNVISDALSAMSLVGSNSMATAKPALLVRKCESSGISLSAMTASLSSHKPSTSTRASPSPIATPKSKPINIQSTIRPTLQSSSHTDTTTTSILAQPSELASFWASSTLTHSRSLATHLRQLLNNPVFASFLEPAAAVAKGVNRFEFESPSPDDVVLAARTAKMGGSGASKSVASKPLASKPNIAQGVKSLSISSKKPLPAASAASSSTKGTTSRGTSPIRDASMRSSSPTRSVALPPPPPASSKSKKINVLAEYEKRNKEKSSINLVIVGHVDAGKSTLMGHLLYLLGEVNERTMKKYERDAEKMKKGSFSFAWVLDETDEERSRGVTIDVGMSFFETPHHKFTILDAPGHRDFIPNMISGASQADVALLVVASNVGEFEAGFELGGQTREHSLLVRSLGVSQLVVAINKLDMMDWAEYRFLEIKEKMLAFLTGVGFKKDKLFFIPCSGFTGENMVARKSDVLSAWYSGPTLQESLDALHPPPRALEKPFRLPIVDFFKGGLTAGVGGGLSISGRIESGTLQIGETVTLMPLAQHGTIRSIERNNTSLPWAVAGDNIVATLHGLDVQQLSVGNVLCGTQELVPIADVVECKIVTFDIGIPLTLGVPVVVHHQSASTPGIVSKLVAILDKSTGEVSKKNPRALPKNVTAIVHLKMDRPICVELAKDSRELGRLMIRSGSTVVAAGIVTEIMSPPTKSNWLPFNGMTKMSVRTISVATFVVLFGTVAFLLSHTGTGNQTISTLSVNAAGSSYCDPYESPAGYMDKDSAMWRTIPALQGKGAGPDSCSGTDRFQELVNAGKQNGALSPVLANKLVLLIGDSFERHLINTLCGAAGWKEVLVAKLNGTFFDSSADTKDGLTRICVLRDSNNAVFVAISIFNFGVSASLERTQSSKHFDKGYSPQNTTDRVPWLPHFLRAVASHAFPELCDLAGQPCPPAVFLNQTVQDQPAELADWTPPFIDPNHPFWFPLPDLIVTQSMLWDFMLQAKGIKFEPQIVDWAEGMKQYIESVEASFGHAVRGIKSASHGLIPRLYLRTTPLPGAPWGGESTNEFAQVTWFNRLIRKRVLFEGGKMNWGVLDWASLTEGLFVHQEDKLHIGDFGNKAFWQLTLSRLDLLHQAK
ncbi:HBS1-like protein [Podochytrium sp. JEL0797]|nr:HBS1-like protein [Podochytrium sp. JEL0797]